MYSNEAERADKDIYDDFKLKTLFDLYGLYKKHFIALRVNEIMQFGRCPFFITEICFVI